MNNDGPIDDLATLVDRIICQKLTFDPSFFFSSLGGMVVVDFFG